MAKKPTFINVDYGAVWDARAENDLPDGDDWPYLAEELVNQKIKVTLSMNTRGDGYSVTLTDKLVGSPNAGFVLNNWGSGYGKCMARLYFFVQEAQRLEVSWEELHKKYMRDQVDDVAKFKEFIQWQRSQGKL